VVYLSQVLAVREVEMRDGWSIKMPSMSSWLVLMLAGNKRMSLQQGASHWSRLLKSPKELCELAIIIFKFIHVYAMYCIILTLYSNNTSSRVNQHYN